MELAIAGLVSAVLLLATLSLLLAAEIRERGEKIQKLQDQNARLTIRCATAEDYSEQLERKIAHVKEAGGWINK